MKLRELINESYFPGLYHLSKSGDINLSNLKTSYFRGVLSGGKPRGGFWMAKGLTWLRWSEGEDYNLKNLKYIYRVKLKPNAKIFPITEKILPKISKKVDFGHIKSREINFKKLLEKYDGFQVYNISDTRLKDIPGFSLSPFYLWDVPSIVIFKKEAIQSIKRLGETKDIVKKEHRKYR